MVICRARARTGPRGASPTLAIINDARYEAPKNALIAWQELGQGAIDGGGELVAQRYGKQRDTPGRLRTLVTGSSRAAQQKGNC